MKSKIKSTDGHDTHPVQTVAATGRLKAYLLLTFGIFVLCAALLEYTIVKFGQPAQGITSVRLLCTVASLPAYFIVLFARECFNTWRQRKRVARMVTQLHERLSADAAGSTRTFHIREGTKPLGTPDSDTLVRKIVQMING